MRQVLLALCVMTMPVAWAQKTTRPSEADVTAHIKHHLRILSDVGALVPKAKWPDDIPRLTFEEAAERSAGEAKQGLPRIEALITEIKSIPELPSIGDPQRDEGIRALHAQTLRTAEVLQGMLETVIEQYEAVRAHDDAKIDQTVRQILIDGIDLQQSGSITLRAAQTTPGPLARRATFEAAALAFEGLGVTQRFMAGLMDAQASSSAVLDSAKRIREQVALIRQDFAAIPSSDGTSGPANTHAARLALPATFEQVATLLEIAAFQLSIGTFDLKESSAFIRKFDFRTLAGIVDTAWPE